jgi:hypothetical protein
MPAAQELGPGRTHGGQEGRHADRTRAAERGVAAAMRALAAQCAAREPPGPDPRDCLLQQKLAVLDVCCARYAAPGPAVTPPARARLTALTRRPCSTRRRRAAAASQKALAAHWARLQRQEQWCQLAVATSPAPRAGSAKPEATTGHDPGAEPRRAALAVPPHVLPGATSISSWSSLAGDADEESGERAGPGGGADAGGWRAGGWWRELAGSWAATPDAGQDGRSGSRSGSPSPGDSALATPMAHTPGRSTASPSEPERPQPGGPAHGAATDQPGCGPGTRAATPSRGSDPGFMLRSRAHSRRPRAAAASSPTRHAPSRPGSVAGLGPSEADRGTDGAGVGAADEEAFFSAGEESEDERPPESRVAAGQMEEGSASEVPGEGSGQPPGMGQSRPRAGLEEWDAGWAADGAWGADEGRGGAARQAGQSEGGQVVAAVSPAPRGPRPPRLRDEPRAAAAAPALAAPGPSHGPGGGPGGHAPGAFFVPLTQPPAVLSEDRAAERAYAVPAQLELAARQGGPGAAAAWRRSPEACALAADMAAFKVRR